MPSAVTHDDEDPVIASFDVFMTNSLPKPSQDQNEAESTSRLYVLQYPSHRRASRPYAAERLQKPTTLRLKPNTGIVEVDVPLLTQSAFNDTTSKTLGKALVDSRVSQMGASHGLAGGFASGPSVTRNVNLNDIPQHDEHLNPSLSTQTLGGKVVTSNALDPVYMLGSFHNNELHLSHLDSVVQLRPQLHHIDAQEEVAQKRSQAAATSGGKSKAGFEAPPSKLESRAIELKMKDTKEDFKDRNLNDNAIQLRKIQADHWTSHRWLDQDDEELLDYAQAQPLLQQLSGDNLLDTSALKSLQSMLTNDEWLDKMSVPREDGKKGLRAKLKGRDRERARRKKVESQRRQMSAAPANPVEAAEVSSDSDVSSVSDQDEGNAISQHDKSSHVTIKEEIAGPAEANISSTFDARTRSQAPKKRGRPKKT